MPLSHEGTVVAVLSLYAAERDAFSEDQTRLLDLLAPRLAVSFATLGRRPGWKAHRAGAQISN